MEVSKIKKILIEQKILAYQVVFIIKHNLISRIIPIILKDQLLLKMKQQVFMIQERF